VVGAGEPGTPEGGESHQDGRPGRQVAHGPGQPLHARGKPYLREGSALLVISLLCCAYLPDLLYRMSDEARFYNRFCKHSSYLDFSGLHLRKSNNFTSVSRLKKMKIE